VAQDFTLDDFRQQLDQIQAMGARELIGTMPGMAAKVPEGEDPDLALGRMTKTCAGICAI